MRSGRLTASSPPGAPRLSAGWPPAPAPKIHGGRGERRRPRVHAARAPGGAVHRGGHVRHGVRRHQPGGHQPRLAPATTGAPARAANGGARAGTGLRAARPASGASGRRGRAGAACAARLGSRRAADRRPHPRWLGEPGRAAAPGIAARGVFPGERNTAARVLERPRSHARQHDEQAQPDDTRQGDDPAISRPVPSVAGAMAAGHRGDPAAGMDPASASAGGGDHTRHRGLGQDRAHHRDRRVNGVPQRSRHPGRAPRGQRGIALLVAILLVALGTIIAAAVAYGAEDSVYMGQTPPYRTANRYITSVSELLALPDFGRDRYLKLAPYVTALPFDTPVNLCTAPALVLDAYLGHQDFSSDADSLAKNRANAPGCFPTQRDYEAAFADPKLLAEVRPKIAQVSSYFRLTSFITIGSAEFNLYSLLYQDQSSVRPILRSFTPD